MKWLSCGMNKPKRWTFKKDIAAHLRPLAIRADFGLHGLSYIVVLTAPRRMVLMPDDTYADVVEFRLRTPGHVMALRSMDQADAYDWKMQFREAFRDMVADRLQLGSPA